MLNPSLWSLAFALMTISFATVQAQQRGQIIKPATLNIMDPNSDGFVSTGGSGFTGNGFSGYYGDEFEFVMFGIPIVGDGEALSDNQAGPACGISDLIVDSLGFGAYAVLRNNGYLAFRFRIGDHNSSVESYSILIDTDGKMGADDPNSTANNPGFEIDITLIKNANKGVFIYDIDGIESCPTALRNYSYQTNFQIAIADIITCSDLDYFYDFFVPFSDLETLFGVNGNTEMRFVAVTNMSGTCAMAGKISDVGGVDDNDYAGCITCAFLDLGTNQCPTSINNLCGSCAGFQSGVTPKPTINIPVKAGESVLSGTAVGNATIFVDLLNSSNVLQESVTTATAPTGCTVGCPWSVTFAQVMEPGDIISARAKSAVGCSSGGVSSDATIEIVVVNVPPQLSAATTAISYTENAAPLLIDGNMLIIDPDNTVIEGATVSISANFVSAQDILTFTPSAGVSGSFNAATGVIEFTGIATVAAYQSLLRSIAYSNSSENPSTVTRSISFQIFDGLDYSNIVTRPVNVVSVDDPPVAADDNGTTTEDGVATVPNIAANDTDVDGSVNVTTIDLDPNVVGQQTTSALAQGTWTVNASGQVTFTPVSDFNGTASRSYIVRDNAGNASNTATITVVVSPVNDAPVATNDAGATNEDIPLTLAGITSNDTDVDGTINVSSLDLDPVTAGIQTTLTNAAGTWTISGGNLTYTPTLNFNGNASITYQVADNTGALSNVATVTINVISINDAPTAVADSGSTNEDTPVTISNIGANDTDVDGAVDVTTIDLDPVTAGQQTSFNGANGLWSVDASGQVTFTPNAQFNGSVIRPYTIQDNGGALSNSANITIVVNPVNDLPVANDDAGVTNQDVAVTLSGITGNDTDIDGTIDATTVDLDPFTAGKQSNITNAHGTWSVNASGDVTFTPAAGFSGNASTTYTVNDNGGGTSNVASIQVFVIPAPAPPVAVNDNGTTPEETPVTLTNVTSNDTDSDGTVNASTVDLDPVTAGIQTSMTTSQGSWSVSVSGAVTFSPVAEFNGVASQIYSVQDNSGLTSNAATISITVTPVNDAPVAISDSGVTNEDIAVTLLAITGNDTDIDGTIDATTVDLDPSTGGKQSNATNSFGTWTVNATGDVTFTPAAGFNGTASVTYTVSDNAGGTSNVANIQVLVISVNDLPVAVNDNGTTNEDTPLTNLSVTANDTDSDGTINITTVDLDPVTAGIQTSISNSQGSWSVNASGNVTFTPPAEFSGVASLIYTVQDNSGGTSNSATITITVNPINDAPVAVNDNGVTNEDLAVTLLAITGNDTDIDGTINATTVDLDPSTVGIQGNLTNAHGTWTINAAGDLTFTPTSGFTGNATATYTVNDNSGGTSNVASLLIVVNAVVVGNTSPVAVNDSGTTNEETLVTLTNVTSNDTDADGTIDAATVDLDPVTGGLQTSITTAQGGWTVNASGDVTFTPANSFNGVASINYTVRDDVGATSNSATISITVNAVNDVPVALNDSGVTNKNIPVTIFAVTANDTDNDGTVDATTVDLDPSTGGKQTNFSNVQGTWTVNASGDVTLTPTATFAGNASITYTVNDNSGGTSNAATILVVVNDVNASPVAVNDTGTTNENTLVTLTNVTSNDTDSDGTVNAATVDLDPVTAGVQTNVTTAQGAWSVNTSGDVTFTPVTGFNGVASRIYTVQDNLGATSNSATISITVNAVNDPPVAVNDNGVTNKNVAVVLLAITGNDTDNDGTVDATTVDLDPSTGGKQTSFSNVQGSWNVNASADVTFTPTPGFIGNASITYTVNDNSGATSNAATIGIVVNDVFVNTPPTAVNDTGTTNENTAVTLLNVTSNDTDSDGTVNAATVDLIPITAGQQTSINTAQGAWSVNASGDVTFTPVAAFTGIASQIYVVQDNNGATSNSATISITVNAVNDPPVAVDDSGATNEGTPVTLALITSNDNDPDGTVDPSTADLDPGTAGQQTSLNTEQGVWEVDAAGNVLFTPTSNFNGTALASYTVNDNVGAISNVANLSVLVIAINDSPVAANDIGATPEDKAITLTDITANDSDVDGTIVKSSIDLNPAVAGQQSTLTNAQGSWTVDVNGRLSYTPAANFFGTAIIQYTVDDNSGTTSNSASITITVNPINDNPAAVADQGITYEDNAITLPNITSNDTDIDGTINAATVDLNPSLAGRQDLLSTAQGGWSVDSNGNLSFSPVTNYNGTVAITYTVQDNEGGVSTSASVTISVLAVNDMPVVQNLSFQTQRNKALQATLISAGDVDSDGTVLTVDTTPINSPDHGAIVISADGSFTYTPSLDYVGNDLVEVAFCDQGLPSPPACAIKTVTINVAPSNNPPVIIVNGAPGATLTISTIEDVPVVLCFNAVDPDGDPVSVGPITNTAGGGSLVAYGNIAYCFEYTPLTNFTGVSQWTLQVCDNGNPSLCGSLSVTVNVLPQNDPPVTVADTIRTLRNVQAYANVLLNDYDIEGQAITVTTTPVEGPSNGQVTLAGNGDLIYKSDIRFRGTDFFTYQVCDAASPSGCSEGKVVIIVEDLPLKVYEGVSPNGDGVNDYLRIDGIDYFTENQVQIFDRYNNLVFQVEGYNNEDRVWTGQSNRGIGTRELQEETYFYAINLGDGSSLLTGFVVLKRR